MPVFHFTQQRPNTVVFLCNSPKDGFREGDGDLMNKLTDSINQRGPNFAAVRIIGARPPDDIDCSKMSLTVIDDLPEATDRALSHLHSTQQKLIHYIISTPVKNKILYVGSRIDNFRKEADKPFSISVGSGALITQDVLLELKKHKVGIVICCLEVVFYTRSLFNSFKLYEMIRHHLQHADLIHYLTEHDKDFVEQELLSSLASGKRLIHEAFPTEQIEATLFGERAAGSKKHFKCYMMN
jgi:hypothetical protein